MPPYSPDKRPCVHPPSTVADVTRLEYTAEELRAAASRKCTAAGNMLRVETTAGASHARFSCYPPSRTLTHRPA